MFTEIGLLHYVSVATILFGIGLLGVMVSRNVIRVLMCIELMLNAVNLNLVAFNSFLRPQELSGQAFSIFVLAIAAAEAAVGLAIIIALYRGKATVDLEMFDKLSG